jgi:nitrite reductase/ring-hydroxylating ferredoxin subunit
VCPWHQYEFSLATGRCVTDAKLRVRSYKVAVRDGAVVVDLAKPRSAKAAGRTATLVLG